MDAPGVDELGTTLRRWRERLIPADVGLPSGTRRRTPGLRREEVAQVAGVSVDYVTRLEQGRGSRPSTTILAALARALRCSRDETEHLFALAGVSAPASGRVRTTIRPSVARLMDRMADLPAMLLDARGDILAWNAMAAALLGDLSAVPVERRNLLWMRFGASGSGRIVADEAERERLDRSAVADLRAAAARYPDDEGIRGLVRELSAVSERFVRLWEARSVELRRADRKRFAHPEVGVLTLDCDVLAVPDDGQVIIVYSATPGTRDAQALALLRVLGVQQMTP